VTYVKVLAAVDRSVAPTPRKLKIAMSQGGHRRLDEGTYNLAASYIPDGFAGPRLSKSLCRPIPIEKATYEPFEQRYEQRTKAAYRQEQLLVERLERHLRKRGHDVTRHALTLPDGTELRTDLFDHDTGLLVEAKAVTDRAAVRMAIGQLLDYRRPVDPAPSECAVLLPERASPDLVGLLDTLGIALSWSSGDRFRDNRGGALVR
jgi:hypothetical protein